MDSGLNINDFCGILNEALPRASFKINKTITIPLVIVKEKVDWGYPNAIVCVDDNDNPRELVVPRYGNEHAIPGYLKKYLHACRTSQKSIRLYIACPEDAVAAYRPQCKLYGLGLISVSLGKMQAAILERPTSRNIDKAFSARVRELNGEIKKAVKTRLEEIGRNLAGFRKTAKTQGSLSNIAQHEKPFTDLQAELKATEDHLILRLSEAGESGDMRQLDDVRKEIEQVDRG